MVRGILKKGKKPLGRKITEIIEDVPSTHSEFVIKAKSHEELEYEIQSKRILRVLDEAIYKLHIALHLNVLIEHGGKLLKPYFPQEDVEFIIDSCLKHLEPELGDYVSLNSFGDKPKISQQSFASKDNKLDANIGQSIDMIFKCKELMQNMGLVARNERCYSETFIEGMHQLRGVIARKLSISASEEKQKEKDLRNAWKENIETKALIQTLQGKLDKQNEELEAQLNAKNELIDLYIAKIEKLKEKFHKKVKQRVTESEKVMAQNSQLSEERQAVLAQEAKERAQECQTLLEAHLTSEKVLRAKRFKVEAQLASWLAKYDQDIGERQAELEELNRLFEEETEEVNNLQMKLDEQEEEYLELMAERDEYEDDLNNQKAYAFLRTRAVRRIQKFWRAYRERKLLRKKGKKGKKKKASAGTGAEGGSDSAGTVKAPKIDEEIASKTEILDT